MSMDAKALAALRAPFPPSAISKLDKGRGVVLDYVGHAAVTDRLLSVDPNWTWEPMAHTPEGLPLIRKTEKELELWIRFTLLGKTITAVGTCPPGSFEVSKQLISDAIRNGAMRFGVALDLWSKDELESSIVRPDVDKASGEIRAAAPRPPPPPPTKPKPAPASAPAPAPAPAPQRSGSAESFADSIDVSRIPDIDRTTEGDYVLWGVIVEPKVFDGFASWSKYEIYEGEKKAKTQSVLKDHTWKSSTEGSHGGQRMRALQWKVAKAAENVRTGNVMRKNGKPWLEDQRSAVALYEMLVRLHSQEPLEEQLAFPPETETPPPSANWRDDVPF